jgi:hypothetical protein
MASRIFDHLPLVYDLLAHPCGAPMTGEIGILNVGAGDTKLVFDPTKPEDMKRAARTIKDMISRGYVILVEAGKDAKTGEPLYRRAQKFLEDTCEYVIAGDIPNEQTRRKAKSRTPRPEIKISASRASGIALARSAGG